MKENLSGLFMDPDDGQLVYVEDEDSTGWFAKGGLDGLFKNNPRGSFFRVGVFKTKNLMNGPNLVVKVPGELM